MSFQEGHDYENKEVNESLQEPDHPWLVDLDVSIGMPCCHGPTFRPNTTFWTRDLSEENEDRCAKAATEAVKQAFEYARKYGRIRKLVMDNDDKNKNCRGPKSL